MTSYTSSSQSGRPIEVKCAPGLGESDTAELVRCICADMCQPCDTCVPLPCALKQRVEEEPLVLA